MAMENGDKPWFDDDDEGEDDEDMHSHGTCGAGKALGTRFGVSKKATLIVVRMHEVTSEEFQAALELILADLEDHPERQKKSVVTMSLTLGQDWEEDDNLPDFTELFQKLFAMDVPLVCISGNIEEGFEEPEVDEYPPLMEGPDLPLIVVGSVDSTGNRSEFSKGGPHVTLHAVGDPIECLPRDSKDPVERAGTSYGMPIDIIKSFLKLTQASTAAPQVAGEIANLLSYEKVPFDTSDGNLVKNLKTYLQSDAASWERYPGSRVLWNGVREENNPRETVKCNGLETDRYVEQEEVKHLIEDEFCPEVGSSRGLRRQGSALSRTYNIDTPNKVTLSVSLDQGHSVTDCVKYLMMTMYNCYRVDNDPSDYKGGGQTIVGDATYEVYPGSLRSPSRYGKQAGCDSTYKFTFNEYWVWGHGWASSDHGEALKEEIKGCALLPDTWKFTYGIGEDGREWTARFRTGGFQKSCVSNAVGKASGIGDFGCAGSG
ncbi:peptidase S8 S53 domain-containing protein [Fusarium globosum]|uniref:Peptidase S8 S53 domain-containing protein n=1 Tax=Fusarium globosum TaxID=78864 RepID=A0A8H5YP80_9HYPO|nr:peptidase S8 S53 domain-containing protein [Fusarium globosum]